MPNDKESADVRLRPEEPTHASPSGPPRRKFLKTLSGSAMAGGLLGGYGMFGYILGEFVYPAGPQERGWLFVCTAESLAPGDSLDFISPAGARIVVARQGPGTSADDYLALSSVCPHLGCRVHWESQNDRFFCPCHNGEFDRDGNAVAGPPRASKQALMRFPLKLEHGLLFLEAPLTAPVGQTTAGQNVAGPNALGLQAADEHRRAAGEELREFVTLRAVDRAPDEDEVV